MHIALLPDVSAARDATPSTTAPSVAGGASRALPFLLALMTLPALFAFGGCVETEEYLPCTFDPCLYQQCSDQGARGEGYTIRFSCAVQHPQCPGQICLRFDGSGPFCTRECEQQDGADACPGDGVCLEYLGEVQDRAAIFYCVPPEEQRPEPPAFVGVCDTL